jgi:transcriptional regulator with XRE-family HTH domain
MMKTKDSWREVGKRIRQLRKVNGLTLRQLSHGCSLSPNAISLVERGEVAPTIMTLCKIAHALGVSASSLFQEYCSTEVLLTRASDGRTTRVSDEALSSLTYALNDQNKPSGEAHSCSTIPANHVALCVCGTASYELEDRSVEIEPGDRLSFTSAASYRWSNPGDQPCIIILVVPPLPNKQGA